MPYDIYTPKVVDPDINATVFIDASNGSNKQTDLLYKSNVHEVIAGNLKDFDKNTVDLQYCSCKHAVFSLKNSFVLPSVRQEGVNYTPRASYSPCWVDDTTSDHYRQDVFTSPLVQNYVRDYSS
jgi:hypothetical protein